MDLNSKSAKLDEILHSSGSLLIAYSGGADSAFLAWAAHRVLGDRMLAVIADSASLPRKELASAIAFTELHGIPLHILQTSELEKPDYIRNDGQRCFHCKDELFSSMEEARTRLGFAHLAYGMNLDDRGDFRPGQRAATLHHALAPLVEAELTKSEVRALARRAELSVADKPASACLASRIAYGEPVTAEKLSQVEQAEDALHQLGFAQVRVRHHDCIARIEIAREDLPRALTMAMLDRFTAALRPLGFSYVTLDTAGYRSGSMNDLLPLSAVAPAK